MVARTQGYVRRRPLATQREVAELWGVSERTVRSWIAEGRVPAYRVGTRALRLDLDEVEAALMRPVRTTARTARAQREAARVRAARHEGGELGAEPPTLGVARG